jgi:hypothetical protein
MSKDLLNDHLDPSADAETADAAGQAPGKIRKILSIDGGGIRGMFAATFLAEMEEHTSEPLWRHFDLIAGTSTGGIIALGLALGVPAARIRDLYETEGPGIFAQECEGAIGRGFASLRHLFWDTKYASEKLRAALEGVLGDRRLSDAKTRLMVPAFHPLTKTVYIYKTSHADRLETDYKTRAVDVAMSTSAAPTYFRAHLTGQDVGLVDGGVWANNPTGIAVVEAVGTLGWKGKDLRVLNVGCLDETSELPGNGSVLGMFFRTQLLSFFAEGQAVGSIGTAKVLTGEVGGSGHTAVYRVSQPVPKDAYGLDNTRRIAALRDRAMVEARTQMPDMRRIFMSSTCPAFFPCHGATA